MCFFGNGYAAEKSTYLRILRTNIKGRFSYPLRAYLRRNTSCHCAVVKNYYFVADTEIAVTACIYGDLLFGFAVADKELPVSDLQNFRAHSHHSYHLLILGLYEYIMPRSIFSECQNDVLLQQYVL